jgi:outer membrane protein assembly factor BamA
LIFGDNLGDRRLLINLQSVSSFTDFDIQYWNLTRRMQKGLRAVDQRLYYLGVDQSSGFIERSEEAYRYTGIEGIVNYPIDRYRRLEGGLGYLWTHTNSPFAVQAPGGGPNDYLYFVEEVEPNFPLIRGAFIQDSAIYSSFGPYKGIRFRIDGNYAPDFNKDVVLPPTEEVSSTLSMGGSIDFRAYVPISQRMLFAFRAFGASATGNIPQFWYYGGLDTVRGLDYASKYGNTVAFTNLEFRFPLVDLLALPILGIQGIRGRIFLDVGFAELRGQNLDVWNSDENRLVVDLESPTGAVAAYGWGFRINFLGLPMNFDFVRLYDFKNSLSGWESSFYIGPNF